MAIFNTGSKPYIQHFYCLNTDTKPDGSYIGDRLYIIDTGVHEIWNGTEWTEYFEPNVKPEVSSGS